MGIVSANRRPRGGALASAGAALSAVAEAVVDFVAPDACCACGARTGSAPSIEGLPAATRHLGGEAVVPLIGWLSVVNRPFCRSCLLRFEAARADKRLGSYGVIAGTAWVRTVDGDPFLRAGRRGIDFPAGPGRLGPREHRLVSPFIMNDAALNLARLIKFGRRRSLAQLASAAMAQAYVTRIGRGRHEALVPVPMHPSRLRRRGFNQAELLAQGVSRITGVPVNCAIDKPAKTPPQSETDRDRRAQNVRGAFELSGARLGGSRVCLVDDLVTTGSTAAACTAVLLSAGAVEVTVLSLARTT